MRIRLLILIALAWSLVLVSSQGLTQELPAAEYEAYVVQEGQTWSSIAESYHLTPDLLAAYNQKNLSETLLPAEIIRIPLVPGALNIGTSSEQPGDRQNTRDLSTDEMPIMSNTLGTMGVMISTTPQAPPVPKTPPPPDENNNNISQESELMRLFREGKLPSNMVAGVIGKVFLERTTITSQPGSGRVLFSRATRGMDIFVTEMPDGDYYGVMMADGSTGWLPKVAVEMTDIHKIVARPSPEMPAYASVKASAGRLDIIKIAMAYIGTPYRLGGKLPDSVDCSGLVKAVFAKIHLSLPRTAAEQYKIGESVEYDDLQVGDRLYFVKGKSDVISHTGIYIGSGHFIHASSNRGCVAIDSLSNPTYWSKFVGARR